MRRQMKKNNSVLTKRYLNTNTIKKKKTIISAYQKKTALSLSFLSKGNEPNAMILYMKNNQRRVF